MPIVFDPARSKKWMFGVDALFTGTMLVGLFAVLLLGARPLVKAPGFCQPPLWARVGMIGFFVLIVGGCGVVIGGIIGYAGAAGDSGRHAGRDAALSSTWAALGGLAIVLTVLLGWLDCLMPPHTGKGVSIYVKIDQTEFLLNRTACGQSLAVLGGA